jgi:hypothetical protein
LQLAVWFGLARYASHLGFRGMTGPRLIGTLVCAYAGWLGVMSMLSRNFAPIGWLTGAAALVGLIVWFRWRAFDIVVLSLACLTGIGLVVVAAGRWLADRDGGFGAFLLLAMITIGLAVVAATWLLRAWRPAGERAA